MLSVYPNEETSMLNFLSNINFLILKIVHKIKVYFHEKKWYTVRKRSMIYYITLYYMDVGSRFIVYHIVFLYSILFFFHEFMNLRIKWER